MSQPLGRPRVAGVVREALASVARARVPSLLVAVLVAAVCATTLLTVGRASAAEAQVAARMDGAGARDLRVSDTSETLLTPAVLGQVAGLSLVERTVGLGPTADATNTALGRGGTPRATYRVTAGMDELCTLTAGRDTRPGEAWVSDSAMADLGLATPFGSVTTTDGDVYPIVGSCAAREPYVDLVGVLANTPSETTRTLAVITTSAQDSSRAQQAVLSIVAAPDPTMLQVRSPVTLAQVRTEVVGDLAADGRGLLLLVLGAGTFLVAVVVLADTLVRRTDLGRRRALGAPRWAVVTIVFGRTLAAAAAGAAFGTAGTLVWLDVTGQVVSTGFAVAVAVLATLAAGLGALPPAVSAAWQDSVRVLRTP